MSGNSSSTNPYARVEVADQGYPHFHHTHHDEQQVDAAPRPGTHNRADAGGKRSLRCQQWLEDPLRERSGEQVREGRRCFRYHLLRGEDPPLHLRRDFALPDGLVRAKDHRDGAVRAEHAQRNRPESRSQPDQDEAQAAQEPGVELAVYKPEVDKPRNSVDHLTNLVNEN
jgi:hypothetical protein